MAVVVQKYGGSSVADVAKLGAVADKMVAAKRAGDDVVVVLSAMGKTTHELLALAQRVAPSPPRRELDMLVSTGERVSMALLSFAIHARGADAISFTGSQSGILTNDRQFDARIIDVRPYRIGRRSPLSSRRTGDAPRVGRQTVCDEGAASRHVRAVVGLDAVVHARVAAGRLRAFCQLAAELDVPLLDVAASGDTASCAIALANVPDWKQCSAQLLDKLAMGATGQPPFGDEVPEGRRCQPMRARRARDRAGRMA